MLGPYVSKVIYTSLVVCVILDIQIEGLSSEFEPEWFEAILITWYWRRDSEVWTGVKSDVESRLYKNMLRKEYICNKERRELFTSGVNFLDLYWEI